MKKLLNIILVLLMMISIVPVNAEAVNKGSINNTYGKITINYTKNEGQNEESYSVYRILDLESYDKDKKAYTYVLNKTWKAFIEANTDMFEVNAGAVNVVKVKEGYDAKTVAERALAYAKANNIDADDTKTGSNGSAVFENLILGYYLVESSMGIVCNLNTTNNEITINEKNTTPTPDKTVSGGSESISNKSNSVSIGDTVDYTLTFNNVYGFKNVKGSDTLSNGLTLNSNTILLTNKTTNERLTNGVEYTLEVNGNEFTIKFADWYTTGLNVPEGNQAMAKGDVIEAKYNATVNANAQSAVANTNEFVITYGNGQTTDKVETETKTYEFTLVKTDGINNLDGAEFVLYRIDEDTKVYAELTKTATGYKVVKFDERLTEETATKIQAGEIIVEGLGNGNYGVTETKAPEGYNKLGSDRNFSINNANMDDALEIVNTTGAVLPSTGGMGTMLFVTVGSIMALACGVVLVTKFRMAKELA